MTLIHYLKEFVNLLGTSWILLSLSCGLLYASLYYKPFGDRIWTVKGGATALGGTAVFFAISLLDDNFYHIATKPDNVPIAAMIFLVGGCLWTGMVQAWENDKRIAAGGEPYEAEDAKKRVFTWPDLLMVELIAILVVTIILIVWSIVLKAPLEERANPTWAPNPSKAPWYFLGLQELLVYFDPWIAGVLLPTYIIIGLISLPYCDINPKGNGYYSFHERKYTFGIFMFGFVILWLLLILVGTFLRGPNWNFFGIFEPWNSVKVVPLTNINLSEMFWAKLLAMPMPELWLIREIPGFLLLGFFFGALPVVMAKKVPVLREYFVAAGVVRFGIISHLLLWMLLIAIKMVARWVINLKYILFIPEFFFNI